ncbi:MAG: aspartate aminotransferase family protein [Spirochaetaceae bacterium]|nr:aspartate aminotransferase family protein [Spirochaetaceae bacterium]
MSTATVAIASEATVTIETLLSEYRERNVASYRLFRRAQAVFPGGNTRTGVYVDPFPLYVDRAEGVELVDVDGNRRIDFVNNASALILGHAHPAVVGAVRERAARGTAYFAPCPLEVELAELLAERIPSLERLRFCSSGTEAVLGALRAARAFTGRPMIAKFEGAYHGIDDPALISYLPPLGPELGPAQRPLPVAASAGLAPGTAEHVLVLPFNDGEACEALIREHADRLAAVIVDPLSTAAGMALPAPGFLETLRSVTSELGIVLVFDEVVSFRAGRGGMQGVHGIRPDLTCLAKVVAGGTPGGAFGGRADIMALYDPRDGAPAIPQSGTYNGNPIVTAAGLATLRTMTDAAYGEIHDRTNRLGEGLRQVFADAGVPGCVVTAGSLFQLYFLPEAPRNYREAAQDDGARQRWLYFWLMNHGIVTRHGGNVSLPMTDRHVDRLVEEVENALLHLPR